MTDNDDKIIYGDVYAALKSLKNNSITASMTSPPYWKQRNYNIKEQIGQEVASEEYISRLTVIFNKLRQKLKDNGIFFLNVGDKYINKYGKSHLGQIPYRLANHMVKAGWLLLDIIMWYKPNHMPSPVKDRFANTYEPIFVFAKNINNIYKKSSNIIKIPLQQTFWKHTAAYPEKLVYDMFNRITLKDYDLILDPFAGTGTTAVVVNKIKMTKAKINSIMIEKDEHYVKIIKERTIIKKVIHLNDINYKWKRLNDTYLQKTNPIEIISDKHGEVYLANDSKEFTSILSGMTTHKFKTFHRKDAIYFFGVKNWRLKDLCLAYNIFKHGYVLRNMICVSNNGTWFPLFMFADNNTKFAYEFHLDRIRITPKTIQNKIWWTKELC